MGAAFWAWLLRWAAWLRHPHDPVAHALIEKLERRLEDFAARLDVQHRQILANQQALTKGLKISVIIDGSESPQAGEIRHDCGHLSNSFATYENGITACRDCHQRRIAESP